MAGLSALPPVPTNRVPCSARRGWCCRCRALEAAMAGASAILRASRPQAFPSLSACGLLADPQPRRPQGAGFAPSQPAASLFCLSVGRAGQQLPSRPGMDARLRSGGACVCPCPSQQGVACFSPRDLPVLRAVFSSAAVSPCVFPSLFIPVDLHEVAVLSWHDGCGT